MIDKDKEDVGDLLRQAISSALSDAQEPPGSVKRVTHNDEETDYGINLAVHEICKSFGQFKTKLEYDRFITELNIGFLHGALSVDAGKQGIPLEQAVAKIFIYNNCLVIHGNPMVEDWGLYKEQLRENVPRAAQFFKELHFKDAAGGVVDDYLQMPEPHIHDTFLPIVHTVMRKIKDGNQPQEPSAFEGTE